MKFHITITENETGKVIHDADTNAIIGGYKGEEGTASMILAKCEDFDLSLTILSAEEAVRSIKELKGPVFTAMTEMLPSILKAAKKEKAESEEKKEEVDAE